MHMRRSDARNGTREEEPSGDNFARERKRDFGPGDRFQPKSARLSDTYRTGGKGTEGRPLGHV